MSFFKTSKGNEFQNSQSTANIDHSAQNNFFSTVKDKDPVGFSKIDRDSPPRHDQFDSDNIIAGGRLKKLRRGKDT